MFSKLIVCSVKIRMIVEDTEENSEDLLERKKDELISKMTDLV